jgi:hypothetical protein
MNSSLGVKLGLRGATNPRLLNSKYLQSSLRCKTQLMSQLSSTADVQNVEGMTVLGLKGVPKTEQIHEGTGGNTSDRSHKRSLKKLSPRSKK